MAREELNRTFTELIRRVGLDGRGARARPRPHDYADIRVMPTPARSSWKINATV